MVNFLINNEKVKTEELNEQAEKVPRIPLPSSKNTKISFVPKRKLWHTFVSSWKSFPNTQREEKFINLVKRFKVHKTKMISKTNIKLIDKYSGLEKSSVTLNVFKICSEK